MSTQIEKVKAILKVGDEWLLSMEDGSEVPFPSVAAQPPDVAAIVAAVLAALPPYAGELVTEFVHDDPLPWFQGKQRIAYPDDMKVVTQYGKLGIPGLQVAVLQHMMVISAKMVSLIPEPVEGAEEWEFLLPYPTKFRGYWTGSGRLERANRGGAGVGANIRLRTELNDVAYAAVRSNMLAFGIHKKGVVNKHQPWADIPGSGGTSWFEGDILRFTGTWFTY